MHLESGAAWFSHIIYLNFNCLGFARKATRRLSLRTHLRARRDPVVNAVLKPFQSSQRWDACQFSLRFNPAKPGNLST